MSSSFNFVLNFLHHFREPAECRLLQTPQLLELKPKMGCRRSIPSLIRRKHLGTFSAYDLNQLSKEASKWSILVFFNTAIKAAWVKRFCSPSDTDWKTIPQYFLKTSGSNLIFKCNSGYKLLELDDCPQFYGAVLSSWQEVRDSFSEDIDITEEIIWINKAHHTLADFCRESADFLSPTKNRLV